MKPAPPSEPEVVNEYGERLSRPGEVCAVIFGAGRLDGSVKNVASAPAETTLDPWKATIR